jgi:hypothetical protein
LAYTSDESGKYQVYVTSFPVPRDKWQISMNGGTQAHWRQDGKELFYLSADRKLTAVEVKAATSFEVGASTTLFDVPSDVRPGQEQDVQDSRVYAPNVNGQRFLIGIPIGEPVSPPVTVVLNWTAGLSK